MIHVRIRLTNAPSGSCEGVGRYIVIWPYYDYDIYQMQYTVL